MILKWVTQKKKNLNTATADELRSLKEIGEKRARVIIDLQQRGPINLQGLVNTTHLPAQFFGGLIEKGVILPIPLEEGILAESNDEMNRLA